MATTKQTTLNTLVKPLFAKSLPLNDICSEVAKATFSGALKEEIAFDKITNRVKEEGSILGFILDEKGLNEKVSTLIEDTKNLPSTFVELVKLSEELSQKFYKDSGKILDAFKANWKGDFPVNYRLDTDWTDTIENQVLFEIFKGDSNQSIESLMKACREQLHTKETESTPSSKLTEKRADQYTKKVLKWFKLFQKIADKHGTETTKLFK